MVKQARVRRNQAGAGFFGDLWDGVKSVGKFVKDNQLISKGLGLAGRPGLASAAGMLGFGRKKKKGAKKRKGKAQKGGASMKLHGVR